MANTKSKELRNHVLIKVFSNGEATNEIQEEVNNFSRKVITLENLDGMKIVFDYEDGFINVFNDVMDRRYLRQYTINNIITVLADLSNISKLNKMLNRMSKEDLELMKSILELRGV